LLSKNYLPVLILIIILIGGKSVLSEEESVDIWDLENNLKISEEKEKADSENIDLNSPIDFEKLENNTYEVIKDSNIDSNINLAGLYDPSENGLSMDMWLNSDGKDILRIINRINKLKLSTDANEIIKIALLTNSYSPNKNISEDEFVEFKLNFLIKNEDLKLIRTYLIKNKKSPNNTKLIKFYVESYLKNSQLENACEIFDNIKFIEDEYLTKFKIYCSINQDRREEAQLHFDLIKENNFNDIFFEEKFNFLMGYSSDNKNEISEKNILEFHLSHRTHSDFKYKPNEKTPKVIWRYLSTSNLLDKIDDVDLENEEDITLLERATHEKNYKEKDLLELYKLFKFSINQLINAKDSFKLLPSTQGRALLYQRLLLSDNDVQILDFSKKIKDSFSEEGISEAFSEELSKILQKIDEEKVPSNFSSFYNSNLKNKTNIKKSIKINNKVIHQSKLLNYFKKEYDLVKVEKDTNDIIKKIKKNKNYFVSIKDLIILESLQSDGVKISNKYSNLFTFNQSDIPTDIQLLINNNEIGQILLRLAEIIGEDEVNELGPDTIYFIISTLNQLNIDPIRNNILLKVLPLKV
tara:strand:- start:1100 stop:2842 length:1743 start_codon:yes stop_codon:yes gene_type:complete